MEEDGFRRHLQNRDIAIEEIEQHVSIIEQFESFLQGTGRQRSPARPSAGDLRAFSAHLVEQGLIDHQRPAVFTVLEDTQNGRVFADRCGRPSTALIWSDACYLAGSASNAAFNAALLGLLHTEVMPRHEHLVLYTFTSAWRDAVDDLLKEDA